MSHNWIGKSRIESFPTYSDFRAKWKDGNTKTFELRRNLEKTDQFKIRGKLRNRKNIGRSKIGAYYNTIEYIFKALRLLGCLPITIDKKAGTLEFRIFSLAFGSTVFIYVVWSSLVWLVLQERYQILINSSDNFDDSVMAYVFIIYFVEWPLLPMIRWFWQTPRLIRFLAKWRDFEDQYEKVTGTSLAMDLQKNRVFVIAIVMSIPWVSVILMCACNFIMPLMRPLHLSAYWYIAMEMFLNTALAWATSQSLQSASKGILKGLLRDTGCVFKRSFVKITEQEKRRWPQQYMELWRKLSIIVRASGSGVIGPSFVLNMGKEFPNMLFAAYGIITWLQQGAKGYESGAVLIFFHHLFDLIMLGNSAHTASHSAGTVIRDELSLMMVNPGTSNKVKKEIREFLELMETTPPFISIGGYVTINKELISQLMGTIVTYLVVLLQFSNAMHGTNTTPYSNISLSTSNETELIVNKTSE